MGPGPELGPQFSLAERPGSLPQARARALHSDSNRIRRTGRTHHMEHVACYAFSVVRTGTVSVTQGFIEWTIQQQWSTGAALTQIRIIR